MAKNGALGWDGCCVHVRIVDKLLSGLSACARSGKGKYEKWPKICQRNCGQLWQRAAES